jgi:hypothetical protein
MKATNIQTGGKAMTRDIGIKELNNGSGCLVRYFPTTGKVALITHTKYSSFTRFVRDMSIARALRRMWLKNTMPSLRQYTGLCNRTSCHSCMYFGNCLEQGDVIVK